MQSSSREMKDVSCMTRSQVCVELAFEIDLAVTAPWQSRHELDCQKCTVHLPLQFFFFFKENASGVSEVFNSLLKWLY